MQDRPTALELLQAIEEFLEGQVLAATDGTVKFLTRVSINSLRIVQRELQMEEEALGREWDGLNALLGEEPRPVTLRELSERVGERNAELSTRIHSGDADSGDWAAAVFDHVRRSVHDKASIADPRLVS